MALKFNPYDFNIFDNLINVLNSLSEICSIIKLNKPFWMK